MPKQKILLIQSAETQGNGTKSCLEDRGYKVIWAGSGLTALIMATNIAIDLILLDVALPDTEGLDLCRRFRERQDTHAIPIILITARGYRPEPAAFRGGGPDDYLARPHSDDELNRHIVTLLAAKFAEQGSKESEGRKQSPGQGLKPEEKEKSGPQHVGKPMAALITVMQQVPKRDTVPVHGTEPRFLLESAPGQARETGKLPVAAAGPATTRVTASNANPAPRIPAASPVASSPLPGVNLNSGSSLLTQPPEAPMADTEPGIPSSNPIFPHYVAGDVVVDPTTGLFGRPQFEAMLSKDFKRAVRFKQYMSIMLIDLDGRRRGMRADEALVKAILALVVKTIREVDTAAWWSGDSFIVLLPNTARNDALQAGARILEAVATHPFTWPDATRVTLNIGVAGLPDNTISNERQLIVSADAACRRAREMMVPPHFDVRAIKKR